MKQELLPQPVSNAGIMEKPMIHGFIFTRHLHKEPESRGMVVPNGGADSPRPNMKQGGFDHSVQR